MYSNNTGWYFLLNVYAKFYMKMNEIVDKLFLVGDKFMSEMHLKQPRFTYSTCGPFPENKERIQNFKETGDTSYIFNNEPDKVCFQHNLAFGYFKDLKRSTFSDKVLRDKAFNIAKNPRYYGYQGIKEDLLLWFINFLIKSQREVVLIYC